MHFHAVGAIVVVAALLTLQAPMIGSWSDKYGRKPFLIIAFSTASLPLMVILLHLRFGLSMLFYFPAQVQLFDSSCYVNRHMFVTMLCDTMTCMTHV